MSCCSGCESGYDCGSGLSGLYGLDGLSGLMGELLAAGSRIRVGFAYNYSRAYDGDETEAMGVGYIQSGLSNQLNALGVFSSVGVAVKMPEYFDLQDGYITVSLTTADGQDNTDNVAGMIQYAISTYLPRILITRYDGTTIDHVPLEAQGKPGVAQVTRPPQQQSILPPSPPGACNWSAMDFGDYIACQLGIKSPLGGVATGAAGALVGVGVITLLAVVLLKR